MKEWQKAKFSLKKKKKDLKIQTTFLLSLVEYKEEYFKRSVKPNWQVYCVLIIVNIKKAQ